MEQDLCGARIVHRDKVELAQKYDLSSDEIENNVVLYKALSDPGRLRIIHALLLQEMCVCDLAAFLEASESSVSHQLRLLRTTGLVVKRREGNILYYKTVDERLMKLIELTREMHVS